ncbi:MAG: calcium-binding protein, partial [Thiomicrospira sp.]
FWGESSRSEFATTASLPVGVGIETQGARAPIEGRNANDAIGDLVDLIDQTAPGEDPTKGDMLSGAESFLQNLAQQRTDTLVINKITLTSQPDTGTPGTPIVISGTANLITTASGQSAPVEALVIDTRSLPAGSEINLENIEFAVIIGDNVTVRGGEGANIFYAGAGSQNIRLGADDDILYAGDGDDWVGSEGGDDQLFGESGHDVLYGGTGDDVLDGGEGIDFALYQYARAEYSVHKLDNGAWQISHAIEGTDTLINIEYAEFADQTLRLADNDGVNLMQSGLLFF